MAPGSVNIVMHHGGAFSKESVLSYDGGRVAFFGNIDKDVMSYNHLVELARSVGFKDGDTLFYVIPGRSLDDGIDLLKDDTSTLEMMKYANQTNYFEVYIQHKEHNIGGHPTVADTVQEVITTQNLVEVQTSNAAAMNVIQSAYTHELEAQKQTDKRREQLFSVLTKFPEFTRDELVKAALIIGQDATKLNMFFTTLEGFKSAFISEVLRSSK